MHSREIWDKARKTAIFITHSIREAIFLSDRVIVMGKRPSTIIEDVRNSVRAPRDPSIEADPRFNELYLHLRELNSPFGFERAVTDTVNKLSLFPRPQVTPKRPSLAVIRDRARTLVLPVVAAAIVIGCWEAVVRIKHIPNTLLPAPSAVAYRLMETLPFLLGQAVPTTIETIASFLISMVLGIFIAVLICKSRLIRDALYPNIVLFQLIPKIALAPLFIVWLGIGSTSRITFAVFISFFPVVVATLTGLMSVDRELLRLCKAVGADEVLAFMRRSGFRRRCRICSLGSRSPSLLR